MMCSQHSNRSWKQALVFSSYGAIVEWLEQEHGQTVEYGTVYQWVRYRLGAKLKVPRPRSHQQDVVAVEGFKKTSVPCC